MATAVAAAIIERRFMAILLSKMDRTTVRARDDGNMTADGKSSPAQP